MVSSIFSARNDYQSCRSKSSFPWLPREENRAGSPGVGGSGEDVQLLDQGCGTPPKDQQHRGCSGSCKEKGDRVLLGSPTTPVSQGSCQGPWGSHSWCKHRLLKTACPLPGQLGPEKRLSWHMGHTPSGKHYLHSLSLLLPTIQSADQTAAFLFARNRSKICLLQFRITFLWSLFLTSFPNCNKLLSWEHVFILSYFTDLTVWWGSSSLEHS